MSEKIDTYLSYSILKIMQSKIRLVKADLRLASPYLKNLERATQSSLYASLLNTHDKWYVIIVISGKLRHRDAKSLGFMFLYKFLRYKPDETVL